MDIQTLVSDKPFYSFIEKYSENILFSPLTDSSLYKDSIVLYKYVSESDIPILSQLKKVIVVDRLDNFYLQQKGIKNKLFLEPAIDWGYPKPSLHQLFCIDPIEELTFDNCLMLKAISDKIGSIIYNGVKRVVDEFSFQKMLILNNSEKIDIIDYPITELKEKFCSFSILITFKNTFLFPIRAYAALKNRVVPLLFSPRRYYAWLPGELHNPSIEKIQDIYNNLEKYFSLMIAHYEKYIKENPYDEPSTLL